MTPSERLILATLADVYERWPIDDGSGFGPYGIAGRRLGLASYRVAVVEDETIGRVGLLATGADAQARRIRAIL